MTTSARKHETTGKVGTPKRSLLTTLRLDNWRQNIIYIGFVVIFLLFAVTLHDKGFTNINNLLNIVRQTAMIAVMAIAMTFVLSAGEIDLSVGSVAGLASVVVAMGMDIGGPVVGVIAGLSAGLLVGTVNGLLTTRVGIPSFLTTLAMMGIATGTAMWISDTKAVPIIEQGFAWLFGGGNVGPVPVLLYWMLIAGVIGHVVLKKTTFGRRVLATGVLGGTSLFGGMGTVVGTIVGALMIGLINNGLILMGLEFSQQLIARGAIIILAVSLSQGRR